MVILIFLTFLARIREATKKVLFLVARSAGRDSTLTLVRVHPDLLPKVQGFFNILLLYALNTQAGKTAGHILPCNITACSSSLDQFI